MSAELESFERINALKNGIEAVTGESYKDLTTGVQALKNGYGQGGKPEQEKTIYITDNGITEVFPDEGYTLSAVTVSVNVEGIDMSEAVNAGGMYYDTGLKKYRLQNTYNITTFRQTFYGCDFPEADVDLTSCTDMRSAFYLCKNLEKLILRNAKKMTSRYFEQCFYGCVSLTDFDIDVLNVVDNYLDFSACTKLTAESLVNILNALSDNTSLSTTYTVKIGATNLAKLSDEQKQIAINKNISLT